MSKKGEKLSFGDMTKTLTEGLQRAASTPNIWGYRPHDKQVIFHKSNARGRLYIGGNRSGKTVGGVNEDIWWAQGNHPYKKTPEPPTYGRVVGVDFDNGIEKILKPQFARWLPPSTLVNGSWTDSYNAGLRVLTLSNGSTIEFMSYVQATDKFAGTSRHWIHFDEEPHKSIFTECKFRLVDTGGSWWITMTPVEGMTWVFDDIYIPGKMDPTGGIEVIIVDIVENPYISDAEIENVLSGLDPLEKKARKSGEFVQLGGLVFKNFSDIHVIPKIDPRKYQHLRWWASMDHGLNNPTSWHWHIVFENGSVITFDEHYENNWTVSQHASRIHLLNQEHGRAPNFYVGDPAIRQRNAETGHSIQLAYQHEGVPIVLANNEVRAGIDRMNDYLLINPKFNRPTWLITENNVNLIHQLRRYRWKTYDSSKLRDKNNPYEEPHQKDDHAVDDCRYFFSFMPNLSIKKDEIDWENLNRRNKLMINGREGYDPSVGNFDPNFRRSPESTEWQAYDEGIGIF
jgi:phage terminase large subunit-like protein